MKTLSLIFLLACAPETEYVPVFNNPNQLALTASDFVMLSRDSVDGQVFDTYNAANGTNQLSLYDGSYGTSVNLNQYKILVSIDSDHLIAAVRSYGVTGALTIPSGGYVVAVNGTMLPWLSSLVVGDTLNIVPVTSCNPRTDGVPTIMFHDLGTTSTAFESQLLNIQTAGYNTISIDQLGGFLNGSIGIYEPDPDPCDPLPRLPDNPIVLTFDDAYTTQFSFAPAALSQYGMIGNFFVITSYPDSISWVASWDSIADAVADYPDNVTLNCHSHNAHSQSTIDGKLVSKYLTMTEIERYDDMTSCATKLYEETGVDPTAIAWPFGSYDDALIDTARDAGYDTMFNTWTGINHYDNYDSEARVRRFGQNVSSTWTSLETTMNRWYVCP